jgi:hypothetical protein
MPDCSFPPPPSLFGIVPPNTQFYVGQPSNFGLLRNSTPLWVGAFLLILVVGTLSAAAFVAVRRRTSGISRHVSSLLLALGVLAVLLPMLYLLLVGWPGHYVDDNWFFTHVAAIGGYDTYPQCADLLRSVDTPHTMQRNAANELAGRLSLAGGLLWLGELSWFGVIVATEERRPEDRGSSAQSAK